MADGRGLWLDTLVALAQPRRLVPIAVVALPLIAAQGYFSRMSPSATGLAVAMVALFLLVAPAACRWLLLGGVPLNGWWVPRFLLYVLLGGLPAILGLGVPALVGFRDSFLGTGVNTLVSAALFWVGGWGLARDIEQERSIDVERARAVEARREAERAQLLAMRSSLDPHFLFNTLNALAEWTREDPEIAERGILRLSGLLRDVLSGIQADLWPLEREIRLVADVWELHRMRDPSWFTVRWDVPDPLPALMVPPMILVPLAENAVKHGPAKGFRGEIQLRVTLDRDRLQVEVTNPGPYGGPREGSAGLPLVERRLALVYGAEATLVAGAMDADHTRVALVVPARRQG